MSLRNDREASFSLVETEAEKQARGKMPAVKGRHFMTPGKRAIRPEPLRRGVPFWVWLILSFFVPAACVLAFRLFH